MISLTVPGDVAVRRRTDKQNIAFDHYGAQSAFVQTRLLASKNGAWLFLGARVMRRICGGGAA
jgi:hypothetical protein